MHADSQLFSTLFCLFFSLALALTLALALARSLSLPHFPSPLHHRQHGAVAQCSKLFKTEIPNEFKRLDKEAFDLASDDGRAAAVALAREATAAVAEIFPDEFIHLGGDEVDARCWGLARGAAKASALVQSFFNEAVFPELAARGKTAVVWQDAVDAGLRLPRGSVVQPWQCWGGAMTKGHATARKIAEAVLSGDADLSVVQSTCWYLDWDSQVKDYYGHSAQGGLGGLGGVRGVDDSVLLGGEAALWTERVDWTNVECRMWPRLAAVAERLWSGAATVDGKMNADVQTRLRAQCSRLEAVHGVSFGHVGSVGGRGGAGAEECLRPVQELCPLLGEQGEQRAWWEEEEGGMDRGREEL